MEQPVLPLTDGSDMIALLREQLQALEAAQGGSQDPRSRAALERLEAALQQLQQAQQHWQEAAPAVAPDTLAPTNQAQLAQDVSRLEGRLDALEARVQGLDPVAQLLVAHSAARWVQPPPGPDVQAAPPGSPAPAAPPNGSAQAPPR